MPKIEFIDVCLTLGDRAVLHHLTCSIEDQEIAVFCGKSGIGKSVLLKTLTGFLRPEQGDIRIDGTSLYTHTTSEGPYHIKDLQTLRQTCSLVFQNSALIDELTTFENIAFGIRKQPASLQKQTVMECLECVQLPPSVLSLYPFELATGIQKKVAIARALAVSPKVLLFDEPTTGMDPINTNMIHHLITQCARMLHITVLVVSHDIQGAFQIADRVLFLDKGHILTEGTMASLKQSPHPLVQQFMTLSGVV